MNNSLWSYCDITIKEYCPAGPSRLIDPKIHLLLDMSQGRSRIPFEAGQINIHSLSAQAVESVRIESGADRPVRVAVTMNDAAGIFQVDELLKRKLDHSTLAPYMEVVASIRKGTESQLVEVYKQ